MAQGTGTDGEILRRLREGDEETFRHLVEQLHPTLLRLAGCYVKTAAAAEEVAQEAWIGLLRGLEGFEGRSSLRTWLFRILTNTAKDRAKRDVRSKPFSALAATELAGAAPSVYPDMFQNREDIEPGHWKGTGPRSWGRDPERDLLTRETLAVAQKAIDRLPVAQRAVLLLRDTQGFSAQEACNILELSETNQRVLLHRARTRVRRALDEHLARGQEAGHS